MKTKISKLKLNFIKNTMPEGFTHWMAWNYYSIYVNCLVFYFGICCCLCCLGVFVVIKAEVVFDGDLIYCNGKLVSFCMGDKSDYWEIQDNPMMFLTQEQAIAYCLEQSK